MLELHELSLLSRPEKQRWGKWGISFWLQLVHYMTHSFRFSKGQNVFRTFPYYYINNLTVKITSKVNVEIHTLRPLRFVVSNKLKLLSLVNYVYLCLFLVWKMVWLIVACNQNWIETNVLPLWSWWMILFSSLGKSTKYIAIRKVLWVWLTFIIF